MLANTIYVFLTDNKGYHSTKASITSLKSINAVVGKPFGLQSHIDNSINSFAIPIYEVTSIGSILMAAQNIENYLIQLLFIMQGMYNVFPEMQFDISDIVDPKGPLQGHINPYTLREVTYGTNTVSKF